MLRHSTPPPRSSAPAPACTTTCLHLDLLGSRVCREPFPQGCTSPNPSREVLRLWTPAPGHLGRPALCASVRGFSELPGAECPQTSEQTLRGQRPRPIRAAATSPGPQPGPGHQPCICRWRSLTRLSRGVHSSVHELDGWTLYNFSNNNNDNLP